MNHTDYDERYREQKRRQLRRDLDEMGYGRRPQSAAVIEAESNDMATVFMAFVTATALVLSLAISRLVS